MSLLPTAPTNPFADIQNLIKTNTAFVNPLSGIISTGTATFTAFKANVLDLSDPLSGNYNPSVAIHGNDIVNAVDTLQTTFGRLLSHSDNISGVSLSTGLTGSNFATISTIVESVQKYKDDGLVCSVVYGAFGVILKAADIANTINLLLGQIQNLLSQPGQIADNIDFAKDYIETLITEDLVAFANAQIEALQIAAAAALTSLIGNPCIGEVLGKVGSRELKVIIDEKIRSIGDNI
jgi:hypothetical protein